MDNLNRNIAIEKYFKDFPCRGNGWPCVSDGLISNGKKIVVADLIRTMI